MIRFLLQSIELRLLALLFTAVAAVILLGACQKEREPIKVGFIGCLTGRSTDLAVPGRNGFMLAVDEINKAGGLAGRKLVPVVRDNGLDSNKAEQAVRELVEEKVRFVVGPMTSQIAMSVVPLLNEAAIPLISPTVSTNKLIGIDDYFFRVYYANSQASEAMSAHMETRGLRKIVALYDTGNKAYAEDWLRIFKEDFSREGRTVEMIPFHAASVTSFYDLVVTAVDLKPDGLLVLANPIDTAIICQQTLKLDIDIPKFATGWSYSGKLITYGGASVEGLVVVQSVDFKKDRKEVRHFLDAYHNAYFDDPTFPAAHAYDATRLALRALEAVENGGVRNLKQELLKIRNFPGILQDFSLDQFGDVVNPPIYFMKIDEAVFHSL